MLRGVIVALVLITSGCTAAVPAPTPTIATAPSATASPLATTPSPVAANPSPTRGPSPTPSATPRETPSAEDQRLVAALVAFARTPDATRFAALPLDAQVGLALDDQIPLPRAASALARADGWVLDVNEFQGHVGPFSALGLLARDVATTISIGPHPRCASPASFTPAALADMRHISVQPKDIDTCLNWWAVDIYVSPAGRITTVALDLWNP